jgi:hypothetical protein
MNEQGRRSPRLIFNRFALGAFASNGRGAARRVSGPFTWTPGRAKGTEQAAISTGEQDAEKA